MIEHFDKIQHEVEECREKEEYNEEASYRDDKKDIFCDKETTGVHETLTVETNGNQMENCEASDISQSSDISQTRADAEGQAF